MVKRTGRSVSIVTTGWSVNMLQVLIRPPNSNRKHAIGGREMQLVKNVNTKQRPKYYPYPISGQTRSHKLVVLKELYHNGD